MTKLHRATRHGPLLVAALAVALAGARPANAAEKKNARKAKAAAGQIDARQLAARIDAVIGARLKADNVPASPRAEDAEFMRRACLDITGVIPTAEQAKAFLDSKDPDKRAKLIDELLDDEDFGRHMADIWQDLLLTRTSENRRLQPRPFIKWLAENFNQNTPWDKFVHELLTASGSQDENGAVTYFLANNSVDKITDNVTKNLLGVQLQCAQCHNHPFTSWKQEEYWGMAAFFMKVRSSRVNAAAKKGNSPAVSEFVYKESKGRKKKRRRRRLPESAMLVDAKFLQGDTVELSTEEPSRPVLAEWVTSPENPYFARAMTNRLWQQFFGRGLVNPVDDMHDANPASHPELLKALAEGFADSGFDIKGLIRAICLSETYQRTSKPVDGNKDAEPHLYARLAIKALTPEQLYDSLMQALGRERNDKPTKAKNGRYRPSQRDRFVQFFRADEGADPTEYQAGIPQALQLMNSPQLNTNSAVNALARGNKKPEEVVEQLYLATLSRRPTERELTRLTEVVRKGEPRQAYADILWVLLNCSEFALNH